jgi:predicted transcriptional regulator
MGTSPKPTNAELAILRVLWTQGPSTVRQVHDALGTNGKRAVGYTTALKLLQIMTDKGLVACDTSARAHVFTARASEAATQHRLVNELVDRAFGGSALRLLQQALSSKRVSAQELREIRRFLDQRNGGDES